MPVRARREVDLLGTVEVLHQHLTDALCEDVFEEVRDKERRREITLSHLAQFWTAVVLRSPPSLTFALGAGKGDYPAVPGSSQAFFARSQDLSWEFFQALFTAFSARVATTEPACFAHEHRDVLKRFGRVWIVDGSTLDAIARRLKLLRNDRRVPLPGSILGLYDLGRGTLARLGFESTPQGKEMPCAIQALCDAPAGTLIVGDALYGVPKFFGVLSKRGLWGITRRNRVAGLVQIKQLPSTAPAIEEWTVQLGTDRTTDSQQLRLIRHKQGRRVRELITNVLDPQMLCAQEALDLYEARWTIERLFFDLKEVLNLHRFYAANPNAVAAQVYASAIVHVAMRAAQGRIAAAAGIAPELLSTAKLFPKVAAASVAVTHAEIAFDATQALNPETVLRKPDWHCLPTSQTTLDEIFVEKRKGERRRPRRSPQHARWREVPAKPRPGTS